MMPSDHERDRGRSAVSWRISTTKDRVLCVAPSLTEHLNRLRVQARIGRRQPVFVLFACALAWLPATAQAGPVQLTQDDVALAVYDSADGTTWDALPTNILAGLYGPHRCLCPNSVSVALQLTAAGQSHLGSSTISVNLLLGASCLTSPESCASLGQASFSATQSAKAPSFSSSLIFQAAAGGAAVDCANLAAGSTTAWAVLAQDGVALPFALTVDFPVTANIAAAPSAVTVQPGNQGLLVSWTPPSDTSLVAGYQVICLPRPAVASTAGYDSCGLVSDVGSAFLTPADPTEICSDQVPATNTSVRLAGLVNGTPYTIAVIAIDPTGGTSAISPLAVGTPQPTMGFIDKYKEAGGAAGGCSLLPPPPSGRAGLLWLAAAATVSFVTLRYLRRVRRGRRGATGGGAPAFALLFFLGGTAQAEDAQVKHSDDWAVESPAPRLSSQPDWGVELGLSLYRPAVDSEFGNGVQPFADTFSNSRHLMSEAELARYLGHRFGTWGVGLRAGYYKVSGPAFLADGITRSGDETGLRLVPLSLSLFYRATGLAGLKRVPLIPYFKAGLDGVVWTATTTGSASRSGFTPGWHAAAGTILGLNFLFGSAIVPGAIADPCALFFEWDYAAINGLGFGNTLRVGDSTWFAGIMFDL